jgi:hypothetical protein
VPLVTFPMVSSVRVTSPTVSRPPLSLSIVLIIVRVGATSSFSMIHVMLVDTGRLTMSAHSVLEPSAKSPILA